MITPSLNTLAFPEWSLPQVVAFARQNNVPYFEIRALENNLDLRMFNVSNNAGTYTLGSELTTTGLSSTTTNDNVEHLYYNGALLPAGSRFLIVAGRCLSSDREASLLGQADYRERIAGALFDGIAAYSRRVEQPEPVTERDKGAR